MRQGPTPPRKAWNVVLCGVAAILLFVPWYWRHGRPLTPDNERVTKPLPVISQNAFDQQIAIPKIPGGVRPSEGTADLAQVGLNSGWTPIWNDDDSGRLLVDVTSLHLWRKVERSIRFQFVPKPHTIDENANKPILYELIQDTFKCAEKTAVKNDLTVFYEDGTRFRYFPWGYAGLSEIWIRVKPDTPLRREMDFVCAVKLTPESPVRGEMGEERILGTWRAETGTYGRIAVGPIVISHTQIAWTAEDGHRCVSDYQLASRSTGPTYPGASMVGSNPDRAYTTFALELKGPHLELCAQKMGSFTISLLSDQSDLTHFSAFFGVVQGYGTMRRVSASETFQ